MQVDIVNLAGELVCQHTCADDTSDTCADLVEVVRCLQDIENTRIRLVKPDGEELVRWMPLPAQGIRNGSQISLVWEPVSEAHQNRINCLLHRGHDCRLTHDDMEAFLSSTVWTWMYHLAPRRRRYREIPTWPPKIHTLTIGGSFNRGPFDCIYLPGDLKILVFGDSFNVKLEGCSLPLGLQELTFGKAFNKSLYQTRLPSSLLRLEFGERFNQKLDDRVPMPTMQFRGVNRMGSQLPS